jgi:flagellin-like hook-associated protein FlgL
MKKIMWFLIGFSLIAFPLHYAYAGDCPSPHPGDLQAIFDHMQATAGSVCTDMAPTVADSYDEANNIYNAYVNSTSCNINALAYIRNGSVTGPSGYTIAARGWGGWDNVVFAAYYPDGCPPPYNPDADDDGIPDECDFYPDDSGKLNTYTVDWVTVEESTGTEVAWGVQTPYGDGFTLGDTSVDGSTPGHKDILYYQTDGNWYELPADCSSGSRAIDGTRDLNDKQVVEYTWTGDEYEETPGPGTDGAPVEGTDYSEPTGSETDSESLQVIAQNTAAGVGAQNLMNENIVAGNTELNKLKVNSEIQTKQGEELKGYLQDLNTAAGTLDTSVQALETAIDENMDVPQADVDQSVTNAGDVDTEYGTAQTTITGDATLADDAPLDYQEKTNIATKMADYITSNPISDIIENSGLTISGASPTATWNYNGQSMVLTVAGFDTALEAFGQILLGIFTLAGMLLIFRG